MSNETKKTALPKLRFPEFREAGEWVEKELGKLGKFTGGGTPSKGNGDFWQGNIPWVSSSDISDDSIHQVKITRFITKEALKESATKLVPENSILLVSRVGVGKLAITTQAVCTSQDFTSFTPAKDDLVFLAYYLKTQSQLLLSFSQGMAIKGFTKEDVSTLKLFLPSFPEQQKIAATLSSLDDLITAQSAKLEDIQEHKRGLMQGLFPAEGETVPKLRFPEFRQAGEWKDRKLGDVCKMQAGKFVSAAEIFNTKKDGLFPCYGGNGLRGYTKSFTHEGQYSLIGRQGALCGNVTLAKGKFHATEHAVVVTPKNGVDTNWLYYQLNLSNLNQYATGQAQPGLSIENLEKVKVRIPSSELEQELIASCLSSADSLIKTQRKKLKSLHLHKKSLTQRLFPTLNLSQS